ncbi:MAG: hypothetical protein KAY37_06900 [Phycisphaerae bacterium]|nr:hypothetical protein [Phycisphaerae bacterium]
MLPGLPPYKIAGADGNRMLFVEQEGLDEVIAFSEGAPPAARNLLAVDLETLTSEIILSDIAAPASDIVTNGRWVAWVDHVKKAVEVRDLDSGAESSYFEELVASGEELTVRQLAGDRLVIHRCTTGYPHPGGPQYEFIVLDLVTGAETHISDSWRYATFAIDDDYFALMTDTSTNVAPLGLELTTNIDLVNLGTGERQTIAPDLRVTGDGYASRLFIVNAQVIWQKFKPGGFQSQVNSYDIATGTTTTLADDFNPPGGDRHWLRDVSGERMLVELQMGHPLLGETISFELRTFAGDTVTIVEFPNTATQPRSFDPQPRFVGNLAVWTDPYTGEFVIYNLESNTTERFAPGL